METLAEKALTLRTDELEFTTFYLEDLLLGLDIQFVQEINQHVDTTFVPHAPRFVQGIVNLRGEVVTVLDLRAIVGLAPTKITRKSRNVVVRSEGENIGLLVDRIADVVYASVGEIEVPPANVKGVDGRFFKGVYQLKHELLVILDLGEVMQTVTQTAEVERE